MDQKDSRKLVEQALRVLQNEPIAIAQALSDEELKWIKWVLGLEEIRRITASEIKEEKRRQRKEAWYNFLAAGIFSAIIGPLLFIFVQAPGLARLLSPGGDPVTVSLAVACGITGGLMGAIGSKMKDRSWT